MESLVITYYDKGGHDVEILQKPIRGSVVPQINHRTFFAAKWRWRLSKVGEGLTCAVWLELMMVAITKVEERHGYESLVKGIMTR